MRGEVSVRELMAVEFIVGKGGSGLKPHDMGVARFHVQIGVMGLVGLRAGGEHHGPGPDHMHFPADAVKADDAADGAGVVPVVQQRVNHDPVHDGHALFPADPAHHFHELRAVEHERLDRALVGRPLAFDAAVGAVLVLLERHAPCLKLLHAVADGVENAFFSQS